MNQKFENALQLKEQVVPPIWMMRQAGRYHKHYQALRTQHSFVDLCKIPELAAQVALGPIEEFDFDVAILFSDLLFPLEALGFGLVYDPGPKLSFRVDANQIKNFRPLAEAMPYLHFQADAMRATREVLPKSKSLIGFVGSPWTLFTYAIEGAHKGGLEVAKQNLPLFHDFCQHMVPLLIENIKEQLASGAEIVMLFDTAAGELSPGLFHQHVVPQLQKLLSQLPKQKTAYYLKGGTLAHYGHEFFASGAVAGLGYDHRFDLRQVLSDSKRSTFVQGNFDQSLLTVSPEAFPALLADWLKPLRDLSPRERRGWVCGLGHGVIPAAKEANVKYFVDHVRKALSEG